MLTCPICGELITKPNSCIAIDPTLKTHVDVLYAYQVGAMPPFLARIRSADRRLIKKYLSGYQSVLEIGAANGWLTHQLAQNHHVLALDYSDHPITGLGAKGAWHTLQMDLTDLSIFPDGQFDALVINHGLHLFPNPVQYVQQSQRLIRPGGCIILLNLIFHCNPQRRIEQLLKQATQFEARHHVPYLINPSRGYLDGEDRTQFQKIGFKIRPYFVMWRAWLKSHIQSTAPLYCYGIYHLTTHN
ncbi:MAG: hypothetical protein CUN56_13915 [Phototrophicales bacterium]|nr:MAG: hypothetical protein CUN56_13915 [Phototrophicales bacterium]